MSRTYPRKITAATLTACLSLAFVPAAQAYPGSDIFNTLNDVLSQVETPAESQALPLGSLTESAEAAGLTGLQLTTGFSPEPGYLQQTYGAYGTRPVASTGVLTQCGPFYQLYNQILRLGHGVTTNVSCYGTYPAGTTPWVGSELIYPADISPNKPAPLLLLSPGIGVEPGMMQAHAEFFASHGYVVALGYSMANWFGFQLILAAGNALAASWNPLHPLYKSIDFSQTLAVGHSAGGGSALRITELLPAAMNAIGQSSFRLVGAVGINPGPSDFGLLSAPSNIPTLVLIAEHESLVPHPLSRIAYDRATGPKWWAIHSGAYHGTYLDDPLLNSYDATVLAFARYLAGDASAAAVFEDPQFLLAADSQWKAVARG